MYKFVNEIQRKKREKGENNRVYVIFSYTSHESKLQWNPNL